MTKRAVATILWFYAGWYAGATLAFLLGLAPALGPILGTAAAAIVAVDPRRAIWSRPNIDRAILASRIRSVSNPA